MNIQAEIQNEANHHRQHAERLYSWLKDRIIGQERLIERLLIALFCGGHLLVEGAPGLAKTRAIKELARGVEGDFQRIQFTPDLLPSDVTGTEIYRPEKGSFHFQRGPIFHNLVLADEINRAPAKVQSALLEAMAERQVSIGNATYRLPDLFMVMATQNPIEQEGTYPLPEAQMDRFLMHVTLDYPKVDAERQILKLVRNEDRLLEESDLLEPLHQREVFAIKAEILGMHMAAAVEEYIVQLIMATRTPQAYGDDLAGWLEYGASPRGTIALDRCARARAWLAGRDYVSPEDVQDMFPDVLRHRIIPSFEAEAAGHDSDAVLRILLSRVPVA